MNFCRFYKNVLVPHFNSLKLLLDLFVNKIFSGRGVFAKDAFLLHAVATGPVPMPPTAVPVAMPLAAVALED